MKKIRMKNMICIMQTEINALRGEKTVLVSALNDAVREMNNAKTDAFDCFVGKIRP